MMNITDCTENTLIIDWYDVYTSYLKKTQEFITEIQILDQFVSKTNSLIEMYNEDTDRWNNNISTMLYYYTDEYRRLMNASIYQGNVETNKTKTRWWA